MSQHQLIRGVIGTAGGAEWPRTRGRDLVGLAFALAVLFVIAPSTLAGGTYGRSGFDNGPLVHATRTSLVEFWNAGAGDFSPALQSTVDYWVRYHVAKAVIAALLSAALVVLGARAWRSLARSDGRGRGRTAALTSAAAGVTMLALFAMLVVMANVQGAIAPFSSLLSLLGPQQRGGDLAGTIDQIRQMLVQPAGASGGQRSPPLDTIVGDFSRYHAALAVMTASGAAGLTVAGVMSWRACSSPVRSGTRARRLMRACSVSSVRACDRQTLRVERGLPGEDPCAVRRAEVVRDAVAHRGLCSRGRIDGHPADGVDCEAHGRRALDVKRMQFDRLAHVPRTRCAEKDRRMVRRGPALHRSRRVRDSAPPLLRRHDGRDDVDHDAAPRERPWRRLTSPRRVTERRRHRIVSPSSCTSAGCCTRARSRRSSARWSPDPGF